MADADQRPCGKLRRMTPEMATTLASSATERPSTMHQPRPPFMISPNRLVIAGHELQLRASQNEGSV